MAHLTRREMLRDVGRGMFVAGLGAALTSDLGLGRLMADDASDRITFGDLDPLVDFIRTTPPDKFMAAAVKKLADGTDLKKLTAAAALANARAFGGEDYVGFHTLMALVPAYHMSAEEADAKLRPLAVLKVLYRNANRFKETDAAGHDTLKPVAASTEKNLTGQTLRDAVRKVDAATAEKTFAAMCKAPADAVNPLMEMVDDATEVHRVVLVSRSWDLLDFVGQANTHTLLRQSVRFCLKAEAQPNYVKNFESVREVLPKLMDQHKLAGKKLGGKAADDAWVGKLCDAIFSSSPADAAGAVAEALAAGFDTTAIGEAVTLAANQLALRDEGRPKNQTSPNKPVGSCHGDSIGVHGCDSANAWRNIARIGDSRTTASSLILGAYQVASDRSNRGGDFLKWEPYPRGERAEKVKDVPADKLLTELETAIKANDQGRSAALAARLGEGSKADPKPLFALLRKYAVSEDGTLHAEKFYRTSSEEFANARAVYRWRYLTALARVTASPCRRAAPGVGDAAKLLQG